MDDPAAHEAAGGRQAIEASDAPLRRLPADSPDLDPIEDAFATPNAPPRSAAARTVPDLWAAVRKAFTRFEPDECRRSLAAAGCDASDPT